MNSLVECSGGDPLALVAMVAALFAYPENLPRGQAWWKELLDELRVWKCMEGSYNRVGASQPAFGRCRLRVTPQWREVVATARELRSSDLPSPVYDNVLTSGGVHLQRLEPSSRPTSQRAQAARLLRKGQGGVGEGL